MSNTCYDCTHADWRKPGTACLTCNGGRNKVTDTRPHPIMPAVGDSRVHPRRYTEIDSNGRFDRDKERSYPLGCGKGG